MKKTKKPKARQKPPPMTAEERRYWKPTHYVASELRRGRLVEKK
jgi:hypothetical protein